MGLLDQVIGGVLGNVLGGGGQAPQGQGFPQGQVQGRSQGGGLGDILGSAASSPLVRALVMLLLSKAASGGLGDIFGRGPPAGRPPASEREDPSPFGRGADEAADGRGSPADAGNPYGDLAGAFDKPGAGPAAAAPTGGDPGNGLGGLVDSFQRGGLGDVIGSWIGGGENRAIAPNQLGQALGPGTVDQLAQETGLDRDALLAQLAQVLPGVVDKLTPHGRAPTPDEMRHW